MRVKKRTSINSTAKEECKHLRFYNKHAMLHIRYKTLVLSAPPK
jgi:hypothetical protein